MPQNCERPHGCGSDHELTGWWLCPIHSSSTLPVTSSLKKCMWGWFYQRPGTTPQRKKKASKYQQKLLCWKTSMGWRTFLATTTGHFGSTNHFAPRLCVDRPILALPSTALSAQGITISFAGVLRTVSGEVFATSVVLNGDGPQRILMGTFQTMEWCFSVDILKADVKTMWVGLKPNMNVILLFRIHIMGWWTHPKYHLASSSI